MHNDLLFEGVPADNGNALANALAESR